MSNKNHLSADLHPQPTAKNDLETDIAPSGCHHSTWTTGAKVGIGTAFHTPENGPSKSNVWFTLADGVLTEVYYPDVAHANLRMIELVVTDGKTFLDTEKDDTVHECKIVTKDALIYRQLNTARNGKYRIEKTYITDPDSDSVLCEIRFYPLVGDMKDFQVYVYAQPIISNGASDDSAWITNNGQIYMIAEDEQNALALTASAPFCKVSVGHVGVSDGMDDLKRNFCLSHSYSKTHLGHVAFIGQVDLLSVLTGDNTAVFTLAMGFGRNPDEAIQSASRALDHPFHTVACAYQRGWSVYVDSLTFPDAGSKDQLYVAAMALKVHEDKLHPGAIAASLSIPWGESVSADGQNAGGYHLVWPRDLYQIASALIAIGDRATAERSLHYLDHVLQNEDGSFPQNAWVDGTPYWHGLQMDQVAFPILLTHLLQDTMRYESLVKPAADFIVQNGPVTTQERWEENYGYSPSTIAAEIAGLVVAAEMAKDAGDYPSAGMYLYKADEWAYVVDDWTVTTQSISSQSEISEPTYIRISDTKNPDDGHWLELKNGGGWHPKNEIVDAGFLELVRLGIKAPDDPMVTRSLNRIDNTICCISRYGPLWYRYNFDGYGEGEDGTPYAGSGIGRLWPLLSGERGEYEVALSLSHKRTVPDHLFGPDKLLGTMEKSANCGGMIPEQVWDKGPEGTCNPGESTRPGEGTGSATPLAWAMAQYIRLSACISEGKIVEMPSVVQERYVNNRSSSRPIVHIQSPVNEETFKTPNMLVSGNTIPHATILILSSMDTISVQANAHGDFSGHLPLKSLGKQNVSLVAYDNVCGVTVVPLEVYYEPPIIFEFENPENNRFHTENIQYPTNPVFKKGDFKIQKLAVSADCEHAYFQIQFGNLDNPWNGPTGISKQVVDIYLDTQDESLKKQRSTRGLGAEFHANFGWTNLVRVTGNWFGDTHVYHGDWSDAGPVAVTARYSTNTLVVKVPVSTLGGYPNEEWFIMVTVAGEHYGGFRPILYEPGEWTFGSGYPDSEGSYIVDFLLPVGESKRQVLCETENGIVQLPMIRLTQHL